MEPPKRLFKAPRERAPDDTKLIKATRLLASISRQLGRDVETTKRDVLEAAKEALEGSDPCMKTMELDGQPEVMVNSAGIFRVVFLHEDIDRGDPWTQERVYRIVEDTVMAIFKDED